MKADSERIEITISSRFENIELVQVIAEHLCENAGVDEDGSHWVGMAVREAVAESTRRLKKTPRYRLRSVKQSGPARPSYCRELEAIGSAATGPH